MFSFKFEDSFIAHLEKLGRFVSHGMMYLLINGQQLPIEALRWSNVCDRRDAAIKLPRLTDSFVKNSADDDDDDEDEARFL